MLFSCTRRDFGFKRRIFVLSCDPSADGYLDLEILRPAAGPCRVALYVDTKALSPRINWRGSMDESRNLGQSIYIVDGSPAHYSYT